MTEDEWYHIGDRVPEEGQAVYYYFETLGTFAGYYYGVEQDLGLHVFGGESGFLGGDVTYWKPRNEDDD